MNDASINWMGVLQTLGAFAAIANFFLLLLIGGLLLWHLRFARVILTFVKHQTSSSADKIGDTGEVMRQVQEAQEVNSNKIDALKEAATISSTIGEKSYHLVNSAMLIQLRLYAALARRLAYATGKETDAELADAAEKMVRDHEAEQTKNIKGTP